MQEKTSPKHNQYQVVAGITEPASLDQQLLIVFSCWGLLLEYKARNNNNNHHHPFQY
jgi:hypothetical protein